jgi:tetratricopeptide (TPR) repeat protein
MVTRANLCALAVAFLTAYTFGQAGHGQGRFTGIVVDDDGKPVASAKIILQFVKSPAGSSLIPTWRPESAVFTTATDKDGAWVYVGLAGGIWEIRASKDGYDSASRQVQVRQLSSNPSVKLRLEKTKEGVYSIAADLLERANELFSLNKFDEAVRFYQEYLEKDPESLMVMLSLADCLRESGNIDEAMRQYQAVVDRTSANPLDKEITARAMTGVGECFFEKGDRERAIQYWKLAVEKSPTSEIVAANLGAVLFSIGKVDEAIRYYLTAIEIAPRRGDIRLKLAFVYLNKGDYDKARASLSEVIELQPGSALAAQAKKLIDEIAEKKKIPASG